MPSSTPTSKEAKQTRFFFIHAPPQTPTTALTVHNFSRVILSQEELELLTRGLSFIPTPILSSKQSQLHILQAFDTFAKSLRQKYYNTKYKQLPPPQPIIQCPTAHIQRRMKFLPTVRRTSHVQGFSGIIAVENYIALTKDNLNEQLPQVTTSTTLNVTQNHKATIRRLKLMRSTITIKPADKNLGIVVLNTDDYIAQCIKHLSDTNTYIPATRFPKEEIKKKLLNTVVNFKAQVHGYDYKLYNFLTTEPNNSQVPQFYGVLKIHKQFVKVPPVRPIVSQCNSVLKPVAQFLAATCPVLSGLSS